MHCDTKGCKSDKVEFKSDCHFIPLMDLHAMFIPQNEKLLMKSLDIFDRHFEDQKYNRLNNRYTKIAELQQYSV